VLERATKRQQFSSRLFLLGAAMHACAKRTLYVSLGNRRCSLLLPPYPRAIASHSSLETISPNSSQAGIPPRISKKRQGRKEELSGASRNRGGRYLINAYKKDIPRVDSSRSVFILETLSRFASPLIALLSTLLPDSYHRAYCIVMLFYDPVRSIISRNR